MTRGQFGYYSVRSNGVDPKKGFVTEGDISTTNIGLFFQDSWTVKSRLTINAGVRTEREHVPTYATGADIPEFGIEFGFADKFAPRIGAAYDLKGDGRTKLFGNWGVFYDIFKLELPRGSFGGDKWLEYLLHARHAQLDDPGGRRELPAGLPRHAHSRTGRLPSSLVRIRRHRAGSQADAPGRGVGRC